MRTTEEEVKAIVDTELTAAQIAPFLRVANHLVTDLLSTSDVLSAERLEDIEMFWAAHLVCVRDPRVKSETIEDASWTFESSGGGDGLRSTSYGQQVLMLDTSGTLASLSSGKRGARMTAMGEP